MGHWKLVHSYFFFWSWTTRHSEIFRVLTNLRLGMADPVNGGKALPMSIFSIHNTQNPRSYLTWPNSLPFGPTYVGTFVVNSMLLICILWDLNYNFIQLLGTHDEKWNLKQGFVHFQLFYHVLLLIFLTYFENLLNFLLCGIKTLRWPFLSLWTYSICSTVVSRPKKHANKWILTL